MVERCAYIAKVTGSSPVPPTISANAEMILSDSRNATKRSISCGAKDLKSNTKI